MPLQVYITTTTTTEVRDMVNGSSTFTLGQNNKRISINVRVRRNVFQISKTCHYSV